MEYEEIKFPAGEWWCGDCDEGYYGEMFGCDSDGVSITDHIEVIGDKNE